jgi:PAS domain S-box-containing protein
MSRPLRTFVYTLGAVAATVLIRYLLDPWLENQLPLAAGFWAVAFAVWLGGWRAGLAATLLSDLIGVFLFIEPRYHFAFGAESKQFGFIAYLVVSIVVVLFGEAMWRARRRSETAEASARRQAETLQAIFCSIADAIITTDASGRVAYLNPVAEKLTGCGIASAAGEPLERVIGGIDRSGDIAAGGRRIEDRASEIRDETGRVTGRVHVFRDVTQHHEAQRALRESEERWQLAINSTHDGIWDWNLSTGSLYWSPRCKEMLGYSDATFHMSVDTVRELIHPDDRDRAWAGAARHLEGKSDQYADEYRLLHKDGSYRWVLARGLALRDASGRPVRFAGSHTDITERKRTEQALRDSEQQVRLLTDALPVLIAYVDADLRYRFNNRAYREWFDAAPHALNGRQLRDVLGEKILQQRLPHIQQALRGETALFEGTTMHRQRGEVACEVHYVPDIADDGHTRGFVVLVQDITVRKHAEAERERLLASERAARAEAERASEAKSDFLATLSHEMRTPLTPVLLTVSMMESHPALPPDLREDIATIRRNVELESRLIGDLLDLTRISKGKLQLEFQDVELHPIIRSAIEICQREASAKLVLDLSAKRHTVRGDRTRLQQIFWNLVNNALKFTPPGGTITVRTMNLPGGQLRIEVSDTGAGIDPAVLPKLFNAFEQGDVRVQRQQAGLGLGLAISRKLAEAHGGAITARSDGRGCGATFAVDLPLVICAAPPEVPLPLPAAPALGLEKKLAVLLIEDHEPTLRVMTRLLSSLGHRVTGASSVATATAAARSGNFDVIISDLGLPDGSGLDLMREVRAMYEGRAIALTGYGMESDVAASRAAGFAEHLTKPVDLEKLSAAINRVNGLDGSMQSPPAQ